MQSQKGFALTINEAAITVVDACTRLKKGIRSYAESVVIYDTIAETKTARRSIAGATTTNYRHVFKNKKCASSLSRNCKVDRCYYKI